MQAQTEYTLISQHHIFSCSYENWSCMCFKLKHEWKYCNLLVKQFGGVVFSRGLPTNWNYVTGISTKRKAYHTIYLMGAKPLLCNKHRWINEGFFEGNKARTVLTLKSLVTFLQNFSIQNQTTNQRHYPKPTDIHLKNYTKFNKLQKQALNPVIKGSFHFMISCLCAHTWNLLKTPFTFQHVDMP